MHDTPATHELRARYRASRADKKATLTSLYETWLEQNTAQHNVQLELKSALHKLVGSSGMYGYHDLYRAASVALGYLEVAQETDTRLDSDLDRAIESVIQELDKL